MSRRYLILLFILILLAGLFFISKIFYRDAGIDYSTQIKPILNKKCIACHGGVKKNGGISFLFREELIKKGESGKMAVVPGKPGQSELIRRITHPDPEFRMPPEGDALSREEIDILTKWIRQGAQWGEHWAYQPVQAPEIPPYPVASGNTGVSAGQWGNNPVDRFILKGLVDLELPPNEQADCTTLIRRLSLDLTGLPPTHQMVADFCADPSEAHYMEMVDSLLAQPAFGEHWSAHWLDLARYADTKGFERDPHREIWHYRDWLIRAFNQDLPYDQFTIEQLAGDLLPAPTPDQYTATAFHRNTMSNDEGGTDNEEYRVQAVIDRVNTTWAVWLGTTMSCVQCHSHPYDPIRHEDFYASYAFFNNSRDEDTHHDSPRYRFYQGPDSIKVDSITAFIRALPLGEEAKEKSLRQVAQLIHTLEPKIHPHYFEYLENSAHADTKNLVFFPNGLVKLPKFSIDQDTLLMISFNGVPKDGFLEIRRDLPDGPALQRIPLQSSYSGKKVFFDIPPLSQVTDLYFSYQPGPGSDANLNIGWLIFMQPPFTGFNAVREDISALLNSRKVASVPVLLENQEKYKRPTRLFERGNWLVHGDPVNPGIPEVLAGPSGSELQDRLDFARWIVSPDNPLTARVAVNRFWEQLFGLGLVETSEDFGSQGALPSHPELLDYLAYEFIHTHRWSVKALLRQIVRSATYRQSSKVSGQKVEKDPYNRYLSRGPRVRLTAEQIRDQTLSVSGLLSDKMYGPPVMPPQPDGIWSVVYNGSQWTTSTGEDRYRRAVYTYWRRTSPYPSMVSFDAPSREFCVIRRIRTNTPLQALVALNDPVYLEAAQAMAKDASKDYPALEERIRALYDHTLFRQPKPKELQELTNLYQEALAKYGSDPEAAKDLLTPQDQLLFDNVPVDPKTESCQDGQCPELAALTVVANVILNLDAFVTKE